MTAIALPRPRKRKSLPARVAKTVTKTWASLKIGQAAAKTAKKGGATAAQTAKKGVKAWSSWKVVQFVGKGGKKLLIVPLAAGGGLAAYKAVRAASSSSSEEPAPATPYGSSVGPAATPATVTPPKPAPGTPGSNGEGALGDPPAGASNPPTSPPGSTS
jgi:hypothetical protein